MTGIGWMDALAGIFGDKYGLHVIAAYAATTVVLLALGAAIVSANRRARRALEDLDRERRQ